MRLTHRSIRSAGRPVSFHFNDRPIAALEGETIAAALSAAGIVAYRETPSGKPRGLYCGMGACWDCVVTVDGRIGQRACLSKVVGGMQVMGGLPDQLSPLAPSPQTREAPDISCEVLVVGGGPAGLSAACAAAEAGADVVLLDERSSVGGQYAKPLADSHVDPSPDRQFRLGKDLRTRAERAGVRIETEGVCWGAFGPHEIGALIRGQAATIRPRRLILAPGAHERATPLPGWTLPGVMTTGALQTLVRAQRVSPADRILIAGSGPLNLQLACELLDGGLKPLAVLEAAPRPGFRAWQQAWQMTRAAPDLVRDGVAMLARLKRAGVPVFWNTQLAYLEGDTAVRAARFGDRVLEVGVVAINLGFQPEVGLARALALPHRFEPAGVGHLVTEAGGGLAGLCTAFYLAQGGADVLVIERDELGMAASTANAGSLHVQLLSYDFNSETPDDGGPAAHTLPLAPRSIALWKEIGLAVGEDLGIRNAGGLMLAEDEASLAWLRRKSTMERRWGIESHVLGANELRTLAPAISDRMVGADFVPAEGYGDPLRGTIAVRTLAQRHGARFLRGAEVQAIDQTAGAWQVRTSRGIVTAGTVVNATGPWAGQIGRMVGLNLPVTGTVQQVIVTEPAPRMTEHLIAVANRHLSLKQQASGGFLVGGGWFGSFDPETGRTHTLRENIQGNLWVCAHALPALHGLSFVRAWTGINPAIDRAPILGEAPDTPGFFNAVSANGYTLGPVIGRMTADAILHGDTIDPHYRVERFNNSAA